MKLAQALSIALATLLLLLTDARAAAPAPDAGRSAAAALQTLETARSNLAAAVRRIEKDPPSTADLDAAYAAVQALDAALDAGAQFEAAADLDFAKAVLSARKELRTHRAYVEKRRANVHIHNHRREIDRALADLGDKAGRAANAEEGAPAFDEAASSADALRKALDAARPFAGQDQDFAGYLAKADGELSRHEKAVEDRKTRLTVAKQRKSLQESHKALSTAIGALSKGASDAQFDSADKAASELSKRLEEGKALEPRDSAYRADADRARADLAQAKKRMDELWSEAGLARLKSEIEPAHKDLAAAAKALRARKPTEDQLAEARTAAIVVRKLIEKYQPQAERSRAFGQYIDEVKKTLAEVEVEIQRRGLDAAHRAATQALRLLEKKAPAEEHFSEATTALTVLEKTLETVLHPRDPLLIKPVADARALLRDGRAMVTKRRVELEVERERVSLDEAHRAATQALRLLERKAPTEEHFSEASTALTVLEKTLEKVKHPRDPFLMKPVADAKALLRDGRAMATRRRVELEVERQKGQVEEARKVAAAQMKLIERRTVEEAQLAEAEGAVKRIVAALDGGAELVKMDREYAAYDREVRLRVGELNGRIGQRRLELDVQRQRAKVEEASRSATAVADRLQQAELRPGTVEEAEAAIKRLSDTLEAGAELAKKDREYAAVAREEKKRIAVINRLIAKRKVALAAGDAREKLDAVVSAARSKLEAAKQPQATDAAIQDAAQAVQSVEQTLTAGASLEEQDRGYAARAAKAREEHLALQDELAFARQAHALRQRLLGALSAGEAASRSAATERDLRAQKALYEKAAAQFGSCESSGVDALQETPALAGTAIVVGGRQSSHKDVIGMCAERSKATKLLLGKVEGLISFEEGPKRAFELGKSLLSKGKKAEALQQFLECVGSGRILQNQNPELKDLQFEVAGGKMTLAQLVEQCTKHRDALQPR